MIHILGAGAMGCLWAAHLQTSLTPEQLCFISTRTPSQASVNFEIQSPFLPYINSHKQFTAPIRKSLYTPDKTNIILLCTKSYDALPALQNLKNQIGSEVMFVLFQNGLGSQHQILKEFPNNPVFAAVTTEGVNKTATQIVHAGQGTTSIGPLNKPAQNQTSLKTCYDLLTHKGLEVKAEENIWPSLWKKLAINCAINPFTAVLNCPNGQLTHEMYFTSKWTLLRRELSNMLNAANVSSNEAELEELVFNVIESTKNNISSMLQDVRQNKQTEIEDINGFAFRYLKSQGLEYKTNEKLWNEVKGC